MKSRPILILMFLISWLIVAFGQNTWINAFGPIAAVIGYALFWKVMLQGKSRAHRFWMALIWFALVQSFQLSWMATTHYMGPMILIVYVCLLIALGAQFGLLSLLIPVSRNLTLLRSLAIASIWVFLEYIRLFVCTGFTWNLLGISLATSKFSLQAASLFGIYGLSFWVIFVNLLALRVMVAPARKAQLAWLGCALLPFVFGLIRLSLPSHDHRTMKVLLVQTNILPEQRDYDPMQSDQYISTIDQCDRILQYLETKANEPIDLIVFPEGGIPNDAYRLAYSFTDVQQIWMKHFGELSKKDLPELGMPLDKPFSRVFQDGDHNYQKVSNAYWIQAIANHYRCEVIVGMDDFDRETKKHYNAAFHFLPNLYTPSRTEKRILVPVGEYVPLRSWKFMNEFLFNHFGISDSFESGENPKVFFGRIPFGVSICYEETYSEIIHRLHSLGAQMFVNISNDVWFPQSKLTRQHFDHGLIRTVENGIPLVRACNTGVTAGVDCMGRTIAMHEENQAGVLFVEMPLETTFTLYSLWGDGAILILSAIFALSLFRKAW